MNTDNLKKLISIAKDENLSSLTYEFENEKISFSFASAQASFQPMMNQPQVNNIASGDSTEQAGDFIKAPFVGTFYSSPSPGEPSFVSKGATVKKGQPLCILEAMKIMNEIEAEFDFEILEVLVENESFVEFEQNLFKIRKL